jgi:hypothetical protein
MPVSRAMDGWYHGNGMLISTRTLLLGLSAIVTAVGLFILFSGHSNLLWLLWVIVGCGAVSIIALLLWNTVPGGMRSETDDINDVSAERRRELVRGTSLYLRELRYRYSIRIDPTDAAERKCFSAEVNTIRLGFVPVVIIDNSSERQGYGYAAFVHDGKRWRGPGLPCPGGQAEAVKHAARCVSPLAKDEETKF